MPECVGSSHFIASRIKWAVSKICNTCSIFTCVYCSHPRLHLADLKCLHIIGYLRNVAFSKEVGVTQST